MKRVLLISSFLLLSVFVKSQTDTIFSYQQINSGHLGWNYETVHDTNSRGYFYSDMTIIPGQKLKFGGDTLQLLSWKITPTIFAHWQTAYGWGNHAGLYALVGRTITINGVTFDLSANRSWTIAAYTAGTGISVASNVITNTSPDQTVSITVNSGLNTTGTSYPNLVVKLDDPTGGNVTRSLVTSTSATGFQPSSTSAMLVTYSIYTQASSALAGNNSADVFLETATTNSTTPGDWTIRGQCGSAVVGIISVCAGTASVSCVVQKGSYVRLRQLAAGVNSANAVFTYKYGTEYTSK